MLNHTLSSLLKRGHSFNYIGNVKKLKSFTSAISIKKNKGLGNFCVNYRFLNVVTIKDRFLIFTTGELVDQLDIALIFTKLGLL